MNNKFCLSLILILVFAFTAFGQSLQDKIEKFENRKSYKVDYDKFKDTTKVSFRDVYLGDTKGSKSAAGAVAFGIIFFFDGQTVKSDVDKLYITFAATCGSWCFLKDHSLLFLNDGQKLDLGDGSHDGTVASAGRSGYYSSAGRSSIIVSESMVYTIRRDDLVVIANSKLSEFQLGSFEAVFSDAAKQVVKNMLSLSGEMTKK